MVRMESKEIVKQANNWENQWNENLVFGKKVKIWHNLARFNKDGGGHKLPISGMKVGHHNRLYRH